MIESYVRAQVCSAGNPMVWWPMIRTTVAGATATGPRPMATTTETNAASESPISNGRRLHVHPVRSGATDARTGIGPVEAIIERWKRP